MINPILAQRPMSGFPVSIGTGLALESLFMPTMAVIDETRDVPKKVVITDYTDCVINVATLLRNLISSVQYKDLVTLKNKEILDTLLEEIDYLQTLFQMQSLPVKFYVHTYNYPRQTYPEQMRMASSDQQKHILGITDYCLKGMLKENDVQHFTKNISYESDCSAVIITHVPWDLLSHSSFARLDLLESHTGVLKTRKNWNSKYFKLPEKDMSFLPFFEYLLVTFGDNVMFKPKPLKERLEVYEHMLKKRVHPLMSELSVSFMRS